MTRALVLTNETLAELQDLHAQHPDLTVCAPGALASHTGAGFDAAFVRTAVPALAPVLAAVASALRPGGRVSLELERSGIAAAAASSQLTLAGFVGVAATDKDVTATRPEYEVGAATAIKLPAKTAPKAAKAVWTVSADDGEDELLGGGGESLLEEEDLAPVSAPSEPDCGTGDVATRKACKNCSCGLGGPETKPKEDRNPAEPMPASSCGNCYLGDAFRCGGCPYRGLPAFKAGEQVLLSKDFLKDD